jgi:phosphoglycerol transferase MdoB-like AlkP superfamily enzyme
MHSTPFLTLKLVTFVPEFLLTTLKMTKKVNVIFNNSIFNRYFVVSWITAFATILVFTLLWCYDTTFRAMSLVAYYPNNILLALILCLPAMLSSRRWVQLIVLLLFDALLEANLMYCRTYFNAIPAESYLLAGNLKDFTASVFDSLRLRDILLPLVSIAGYIVNLKLVRKPFKRPSWFSYLWTVVFMLFLSWIVSLFNGGYKAHLKKLSDSCYHSTCVAPAYTVFGFVIYDAINGNQAISQEDQARVSAWLDKNNRLKPATATQKPRNIVLIFCESFESWPINCTVDGKQLTPFLNSVVADSTTLFVPNVATQVGAGRSIDAQLLLLAGMYPMTNNVYSVKAPSSTYFTIPKAVKEHGGKTWLMTCDKPHVWNQNLVTKAFGIDNFIHDDAWTNDQPIGVTKRLSDKRFFEQSVEKMKKGEIWPEGQYAFVMWVTYSGHAPFELPDEIKRISFDKNKYTETLSNYMSDVNYTDSALQTLVEYLRTRSDWNNTSVVIVGDHEGLANYRDGIVANKNCSFVSPGQYTPLIVINSPVGGHIDKTVGQIDIYPTLSQLFGINDYKWQGLGESILADSHPGVAINYSHRIIGNEDNHTTEAQQKELQNIQQISDLIIRYDLFSSR